MLIPLVIVIQIAMPGTLGTFRAILKPSYVIQEQSRDMGTGQRAHRRPGAEPRRVVARPRSSARASGPAWSATDLGPGGTATAGGAQILDDQWLGTLLEIGAVGVLGLLWLFCRAIRRLAAPRALGPRRPTAGSRPRWRRRWRPTRSGCSPSTRSRSSRSRSSRSSCSASMAVVDPRRSSHDGAGA